MKFTSVIYLQRTGDFILVGQSHNVTCGLQEAARRLREAGISGEALLEAQIWPGEKVNLHLAKRERLVA